MAEPYKLQSNVVPIMKANSIAVASFLLLSLSQIPVAQSQWVQTNGPFGGDVTAFARLGPRVLAATNTRVFASTDAGRHWAPSDSGIKNDWVGYFAVAGSTIYGGADSGVYRSLDSGISWSRISADPRLLNINSVALIGTEIFVSSLHNGVFRSIDQGYTWTHVSQGLLFGDGVTCLAASDTTLFAGSDSGIFRSSDRGNTWSITTPPTFNYITDLAVSRLDIFAIRGEGLLHSTNNGNSWDSTVAPPDTIGFSQFKQFKDLFADDTSLLVASYGGGLYRLSRSEQWGVTYLGRFGKSTNVVTPTDSGFLIGTNYGGVYRSGKTVLDWPPSNDGLTSSYVRCVALGDFGILAAGSGFHHIVRSTDDGAQWTVCDSGLPPDGIPEYGVGNIYSLIPQGQRIYACTDAGLFRSTDSGRSWVCLTTDLTYNSAFGFAQVDTTLYLCTSDGLYRSTDDGLSWQLTGLSNKFIVTCTPIGPNLFAGGSETGLYRSSDGGATWKTVSSGLTNLEIMCMASIGPHLFLGTYGGLFRSEDNGDHWVNISASYGLDTSIETVVTVGFTVFVGTVGRGIYVSTDFGSSWTNAIDGMGKTFHTEKRSVLNLAAKGRDLYAATWGAGVWKRDVSQLSVPLPTSSAETSSIALSAVPIPVSERTTISVSNAQPQHVEIIITNMLGADVSRLYSGMLEQGSHSFDWDARSFPSGCYLCAVRTLSGERHTLPLSLVH